MSDSTQSDGPRHPWDADLITWEPTPPWEEYRRSLEHVITTAPTSRAAVPLTLDMMRLAVDAVLAAPYTRDRYVIPAARWHRMMVDASPEFRAELESLRANGTVITSSMLPDDDHAYRIAGHVATYEIRDEVPR